MRILSLRKGSGRWSWVGTLVPTATLAAMLAGGAGVARAQVSIGIQIGAPPPPRAVVALPPQPAPEFVWVEGYWYPVGRHYRWHAGYWTRPPYMGARWMAPRYEGGRFFEGYWEGDRGRFDHDHHWDHDHDRDRDRWRDHDDHDRDHHDRDDHHDHDDHDRH